MFSLRVPSFVAAVKTVTITAIQLAVHMGFNPIYLIGCDTRYTIPASVLEDSGNRQALLSTLDDDPNHFDPRYFGYGRRWHQPNPELMVQHYQLVEAVLSARGVAVFNATVGGDLEVFPRVDYASLFDRANSS
jgi:hypothetical protein